MSDLKVIDSHFHVWDLGTQSLPWLEGADCSFVRSYAFDELAAAYGRLPGVEFMGGVYVEVDCADPVAEDRIAFDLMARYPEIRAAMLRSEVSPWMRLPLHATGVREPLHIASEPRGRCLEPSFIDGLRALAAAGKPFESCNRVGELEDAYEAFSQVPEATVILNHLGNVDALDEAWCSVMRRFAKLPNLYVKVSGYPTADRGFVTELLAFVRETFAHDRLLYASNWPVVEMYSTFEEHFNLVRDAFGDDEDLFMNNAVRAYGIQL